MSTKLNFRANNPGCVQFGNFINYYDFNKAEERLKLLPTDIWNSTTETFTCLDIGCNAGDLTVKLQDFIAIKTNKECYMLGIDLDNKLIDRANEHSNKHITFESVNFMEKEVRNRVLQQFLNTHNANKFNAVFCFSITMWIHLNHGDSGLMSFLYDVCDLGNIIVIEPQCWRSYRTAVKRYKQADEIFPLFKSLQIRNNVVDEIDSILSSRCKKVRESDQTKWKRRLSIYLN